MNFIHVPSTVIGLEVIEPFLLRSQLSTATDSITVWSGKAGGVERVWWKYSCGKPESAWMLKKYSPKLGS